MRRRRLLIFRRPWLLFSLIKVAALGIYGILLHASRIAMVDPTHAKYKTLLFAGVGFSLMAIIGSSLILKFKGIQWRFPIKGIILATLAGVASGTTALGILLAFSAGGTPAVVMTILFTGASAYQCCCCFGGRHAASGRLTMAVSCRSPVSNIGYLYGNSLSAGDVTKLSQLMVDSKNK